MHAAVHHPDLTRGDCRMVPTCCSSVSGPVTPDRVCNACQVVGRPPRVCGVSAVCDRLTELTVGVRSQSSPHSSLSRIVSCWTSGRVLLSDVPAMLSDILALLSDILALLSDVWALLSDVLALRTSWSADRALLCFNDAHSGLSSVPERGPRAVQSSVTSTSSVTIVATSSQHVLCHL